MLFTTVVATAVFIVAMLYVLNVYNKKYHKFHGYNHANKKLKKNGLYHGIVAFGSARIPDNDPHIKEIEEISALCATRIKEQNKKISFITGDGPSVMTAWLKPAAQVGIQTAGFAITLPFEESTSGYSDKKISYTFTNFPARKQVMFDHAMAYVIFKGGFGTMDEVFNLLVYITTGRAEKKPIFVYPKSFYKNILNFDEFVKNGTIGDDGANLLTYFDTKEELLKALFDVIDNADE